MQKKTVFIVISLLIPIIAFAQHAIGSWQTYMSYHNVTHSEPAGTLVSSLSYENKLPLPIAYTSVPAGSE